MKTEEFAPPTVTARRVGAWRTILWIGFLAGTLDISENLIFNQLRGITPTMVFQFIASGLVGMRAFHDGEASLVLGVAIHYTIALFWTAVFYALSRKLPMLTRRPVICGLLYGGLVYVIMNFAVLPFSGIPHAPAAMTLASRISGVLALLFCIGLTISLLVRRSAPCPASQPEPVAQEDMVG